MAVWPPSLPAFNQFDHFIEILADRTLRTTMEEGPDKTRALPNARTDRIQGTKTFTTAETAILDTFYKTTLVGGSLSFDDTHPRTGNGVTFKFVGPPSYPWLGGDLWNCNLELEILP